MAAQYRARARLKGWASCWARASAAWLLATAWSGYPRSQRDCAAAIAATHPRVVPAVERGMGAVPLRLIEPQPLFLVRPGGGQLAAREQAGPQGMVGLEQEVRVVEALGQAAGAALPTPASSDSRRARYTPARVPTARGRAAVAPPPAHTARGRGCTAVPPLGPPGPWSPSTPCRGSSARPAPAGCARGVSGRVVSRSKAVVKWLTASA